MNTRVVDQAVEAAEVVHRRCHQSVGNRRIAHRAGGGQGPAALPGDLRHQGVEQVGIQVVDHQGGTFRGEVTGQGATDAATGASQQEGLAGEVVGGGDGR